MGETIKRLIRIERVSQIFGLVDFKSIDGHASSALAALRQKLAVFTRIDLYAEYATVGTRESHALQVERHI